jgi:hypothetical protein
VSATPPPPPAPPESWPPAPPPAGAPGSPAGTNGLAVASLVCGVLSCLVVTAVLAVVFGNLALARIEESGRRERGRGLAIGGIVLGWIGIALLGVLAVAWLGYGISNA